MNLILKIVKNHRDLSTNESNVKKGGSYIFEIETNSYTLYGESYEFGAAKIEDTKNASKMEKIMQMTN